VLCYVNILDSTLFLFPPSRTLWFHRPLFVSRLSKNFLTDFHKIRRKGGTEATEEITLR